MQRRLRLLTLLLLAGMASGCAIPVPSGDTAVADDAGSEADRHDGVPETLRATGNEPSWLLRIDDGRLRLQRPGAATIVDARLRVHGEAGATTILRARDGDRRVSTTIRRRLCRDSMSGMPHPYQVSVHVDGQMLNGCGGAPVTLLQAGDWIVEAIDGEDVDADRPPGLNFREEGQVSGNTGCNIYRAGLRVTGEALSIGQPAVTRRACTPSRMDTEQAFLKALADSSRFDITPDGRLNLLDGDGPRLVARPAH